MTAKKTFPTLCPSCGGGLHVHTLHCAACDTTISGCYRIPAIMQLRPDEQHFVEQFLLSSGSLKEMARQMSLSYPTVRNLLDEIIDKLKKIEEYESTR